MMNNNCIDLYNYWYELCGGRSAPDYNDFNPWQIRHILPNMFVIAGDDNSDYRYNFDGDLMRLLHCRDVEGLSFFDIWQRKDEAIIKNILNAITNDHALAIMSIDVFNQRGSSEEFELILLPLHERDRSDQLLGGVFTNYSPYWLGLFPALRLHIKSLELIWPNSDQAIRNNKQSMICSYDKGLRPPRSSFPDQAANHNGVTAGRHILDCIANRRRQETPLYLLKSDKLSSGDQASHNKPNLTLKKRLKLIDGGKKL